MAANKFRAERVKIEDLSGTAVQAPWRTNECPTMRTLRESMEASGQWMPVCAARIGGRLVMIDGHRRKQAAKDLGWTHLDCKIVDAMSVADAQAMFARLNSTMLSHRGRDVLYGWATAADADGYLAVVRPSQARNTRRFLEIFGEDSARQYAMFGQDPAIANMILKIQRVIATITVAPQARRIGTWIIKHKASALVGHLCSNGTQSQIRSLAAHITDGTPYNARGGKRMRRPR